MAHKGAKRGPSREHKTREWILAEVARYDRRGYSVAQIAEIMCVSPGQVRYDLKEVKKEYLDRAMDERKVAVQAMLDGYREIRAVAWEAYDRSTRNAKKRTEEWAPKISPKQGGADKGLKKPAPGSAEHTLIKFKEIIQVHGRLPANEYLQTVMQTYKAERELLGLDEPDKLITGTINLWDLFKKVKEGDTTDEVEDQIREAGRIQDRAAAEPDLLDELATPRTPRVRVPSSQENHAED